MDTWYLPNTWRNAAQVIPKPHWQSFVPRQISNDGRGLRPSATFQLYRLGCKKSKLQPYENVIIIVYRLVDWTAVTSGMWLGDMTVFWEYSHSSCSFETQLLTSNKCWIALDAKLRIRFEAPNDHTAWEGPIGSMRMLLLDLKNNHTPRAHWACVSIGKGSVRQEPAWSYSSWKAHFSLEDVLSDTWTCSNCKLQLQNMGNFQSPKMQETKTLKLATTINL